ncbi:MAG: rRNA methyltransferase [Micrococcales bacterium]|nr:MAG: rRNA methyltransferase [Micrococcales bacterium]PIE27709.1 MAG: rRNA methyltransferase [Micrococcales bacterium]
MNARIVRIEDPEDDAVGDYTKLTDVALRRRTEPERGLYIAESMQVIRRALAAGHRPRSLLMAAKWLDAMADVLQRPDLHEVPVYVAEEKVLEAITGFHVHRGALAAMHRPPCAPLGSVLATARRVVVLEDIVDHTNVGAIFRAAAGLGVDAVLVSPRCADPLYRRSVRVSMGAVFAVPWVRVRPWPQVLEHLHSAGFTLAALTPGHRAVDLGTFEQAVPDRLAWLLGTEGTGLSPSSLLLADLYVRIPMAAGIDSLNVAAAAAVAFWSTRPQN